VRKTQSAISLSMMAYACRDVTLMLPDEAGQPAAAQPDALGAGALRQSISERPRGWDQV